MQMSSKVWYRASRCESSMCVEVARVGDEWHMRDSKLSDDSPILRYTRAEWAAFIGGVKDREFEIPAGATDSLVEVRDSKDPDGPTLKFTVDEWLVFTDAIKHGEFNIKEEANA